MKEIFQNLLSYFTKDMLFDPAPSASDALIIVYLVCFGLVTLAAIVWFFLKGEIKRILTGYFSIFMTVGVLGLIYTFVRYERLPNLSTRIVLMALIVGSMIWLVTKSYFTVSELNKLRDLSKIENKYKKYLPKPKKQN